MKKDITFIYTSTSQKSQFIPIAEEAEKRGYHTTITDNVFAKSEIAFYCDHVNFPKQSKLSFILLHDIIQQYSNWPDIWFNEPWNCYDFGILPSNQWVENWNKSSQWFYARPRVAMFKIGWPKADNILKNIKQKSKDLIKQYKIDQQKRTILYAPSWENDNKQDDFVKAMQKLNVNILIKQADWPEKYPHIIENIKRMEELHKDLPNVTILPTKENIFSAIAITDILVSEESSTMCEAIMMGKPAVSVSDWLIPDVTPSRYPKCNYDFVVMTTRKQLPNCIQNIIDNYSYYQNKAVEYSKNNFSNLGISSKLIMDILDDYIDGNKFRTKPLIAEPSKKLPTFKLFKFYYYQFKKNLILYYAKKYKFIGDYISLLLKIKRIINKTIKSRYSK